MKNPGINAANDFETAGGTMSGILITKSFLTIKLNISVDRIAIIIATNNPELPVRLVGIPAAVNCPNFSCVKFITNGVTNKNDTNPNIAPEIPSNL